MIKQEENLLIIVCGTFYKELCASYIEKLLSEAYSGPTITVKVADEASADFLTYKPDITVLTSLAMAHEDKFKDFQEYTDVFEKLLLQTKGTIIANLADSNVAEMMKWIRKHTLVECLDYSRHQLTLTIQPSDKESYESALAAFQVGLILGIEPAEIVKALNSL